jgi:hypothetical protein
MLQIKDNKMKHNLTKNQIALMEHTISGPDRNWFAIGLGNSDSDEFEKLVGMGLATSEKAAPWMGDDVIYRLTKEGKGAIQ